MDADETKGNEKLKPNAIERIGMDADETNRKKLKPNAIERIGMDAENKTKHFLLRLQRSITTRVFH